MAGWPSDWRQRSLRAAGVPVSVWALGVLTAWCKSTPVAPWTNNPLGLPARPGGPPRALDTPYGVYPSIAAFAHDFGVLLHGSKGIALQHELISANSLASAWREIHGLKLPANQTETDYPAVLLDMVEEQYREKLSRRKVSERKTSGVTTATPETHDAVRRQAIALHKAAIAFTDGRKAMQHIVRSLS